MYENIQLNKNIFCIGPIHGSFCTIDTSTVPNNFLIKNISGNTIDMYTLSSNIVNNLLMLEYNGPIGLSAIPASPEVITVEKVNDNLFTIISRKGDTITFSRILDKQ